MNIITKIKNAIKKYNFNPYSVDMAILPNEDYSIEQKRPNLLTVYFKGSCIGNSLSEDSAVKYCWSHWKSKKD